MSDPTTATMASQRARDRILARIRSQQGRTGRTPDRDRDEVRAVIARRECGPQPPAFADPVARFLVECDRLSTTYRRIPKEALASALAEYVTQLTLPKALTTWPEVLGDAELAALQALGFDVQCRPALPEDAIGLTGCFCAIAETGTLVLLSSPSTPKATALLPETHLCVVPIERIVPTMEDAFALIRQECGELPRSTFMISGPSRTADIEQTIVIGAHGPYRVHVVLLDAATER